MLYEYIQYLPGNVPGTSLQELSNNISQNYCLALWSTEGSLNVSSILSLTKSLSLLAYIKSRALISIAEKIRGAFAPHIFLAINGKFCCFFCSLPLKI